MEIYVIIIGGGINMRNLTDIINKFMAKQRRDEEIVKLRSQGKTYKEIGDKFGLTKQAVFLIVKENEKEKVENK